MIIFPLFPNILALFLKLIGEELIVYRIFQILIYVGIVSLVFRILKKIGLIIKIVTLGLRRMLVLMQVDSAIIKKKKALTQGL